mgnify:CR=1 FL=1|jgi:hypothetical protein
MDRLWTRSFILMTLVNFFLFIAFYMLYPTLPIFIKHIGGSESQVGLAMGAFMLSAVVFRPIVGGAIGPFRQASICLLGYAAFRRHDVSL